MRRHKRACAAAAMLMFISSVLGPGTYVNAAKVKTEIESQTEAETETETETQSEADYFQQLQEAGFPASYISELVQLHEKYPLWRFEPVHTGLEWSTVIEKESRNGWNLVPKSGDDARKSTAEGAYDWYNNTWTIYDGSAWVGAHTDYIAYCMDPRNFLNEKDIFQFERLSYSDTQTKEGLDSILRGTFMEETLIEAEVEVPAVTNPGEEGDTEEGTEGKTEEGTQSGGQKATEMISYAEAFMRIGQKTGVSPYHLASRVRQEQGTRGTSSLISGTYKGYEGYYNYFNFGAAGVTNTLVIQNGLAYAKKAGWDTRYKSLLGGSQLIAKNYIARGQDTLYFQKFNVVYTQALFSHQYMGNVTAAITEGRKLGEGYEDKQQVFVFRIPVYNNMPESAVAFLATGNPNNYLKSLEVAGYPLTPNFDGATDKYSVFVESEVESISVSASPVASTSVVTGVGEIPLEVGTNTVVILCISGSGQPRAYTLTVVRQGVPKPPEPPEPPEPKLPELTSDQYHIGSEYITGLSPGVNAEEFLKNLKVENATLKIVGADDAEVTGRLATGNRIELYDTSGALYITYKIVIYGDTNGDGLINVLDMIKVNRHILELSKLEGCYLDAADANRRGDGVNVLDMIHINRHALGLAEIAQGVIENEQE